MVQIRVVHNDFALLDTTITIDLMPSNTLPSLEDQKVALGIDDDPTRAGQVAQDGSGTPSVCDLEWERRSGGALARDGSGEGGRDECRSEDDERSRNHGVFVCEWGREGEEKRSDEIRHQNPTDERSDSLNM